MCPIAKSDNSKNVTNENLAQLLGQNLMVSEEILQLTKKIRRFVIYSQIASVVKIILIVGPLIVAAIYLPPYISSLINQYQNVLSPNKNDAPINLNLNSADWQKIGDYLKNLPPTNP